MSSHIRLMSKEDVQQVAVIDREAFPTMWPPVNFNHELTNRLAHYIVSCDGVKAADNPTPEVPPATQRTFLGFIWPFGSKTTEFEIKSGDSEYITGFVGMWIMVDEAHIINIAVREVCREKGIGELLLISAIEMAGKLQASVVTLEVRVSNTVAQNLYLKYGFTNVGVRKKYYTDNNEDALIMTTDIITSIAFKDRFRQLRESHFQKLKDVSYQIPV